MDSVVTLFDAVNAAPFDWRRRWCEALDGEVHGALTPILTAVNASLGTDGAEDWIPTFVKAVGFDPRDAAFARSALKFAEQAYCECMLVTALTAARSAE
jgi:hypothetical protein